MIKFKSEGEQINNHVKKKKDLLIKIKPKVNKETIIPTIFVQGEASVPLPFEETGPFVSLCWKNDFVHPF